MGTAGCCEGWPQLQHHPSRSALSAGSYWRLWEPRALLRGVLADVGEEIQCGMGCCIKRYSVWVFIPYPEGWERGLTSPCTDGGCFVRALENWDKSIPAYYFTSCIAFQKPANFFPEKEWNRYLFCENKHDFSVCILRTNKRAAVNGKASDSVSCLKQLCWCLQPAMCSFQQLHGINRSCSYLSAKIQAYGL